LDGRTFIVANGKVYERRIYDPGRSAGGPSYYIRMVGPHPGRPIKNNGKGRKSLVLRVMEAAQHGPCK